MSDMTHLDELEAEAIYIMREVVAECEKPVMLYSIGKDSSVMLHLALKAFYPEKPPFPFLISSSTLSIISLFSAFINSKVASSGTRLVNGIG